jgi:hypothetical protein
MIKYRTGGYTDRHGKGLIQEIKIVKETPKQVVFIDKRFGNNAATSKEAKRSSYQNWHDSWAEAKLFILNDQQRKVDRIRLQLDREKGMLEIIKGLKEPSQ